MRGGAVRAKQKQSKAASSVNTGFVRYGVIPSCCKTAGGVNATAGDVKNSMQSLTRSLSLTARSALQHESEGGADNSPPTVTHTERHECRNMATLTRNEAFSWTLKSTKSNASVGFSLTAEAATGRRRRPARSARAPHQSNGPKWRKRRTTNRPVDHQGGRANPPPSRRRDPRLACCKVGGFVFIFVTIASVLPLRSVPARSRRRGG